MKSLLYLPLVLIFFQCQETTETTGEENQDTNSGAVSETLEESENQLDDSTAKSAEISALPYSTSTARFNGSWFSVAYPDDFTVTPTEPEAEFNDYQYVETDEARFLSADGRVEFFIYSPQWSGDPENYLKLADNEELVSDREDAEEVMPSNIHRWVTIRAKNGSYERSYYSKKTESTHLVFGIKYTDQATYEAYKNAYVAFKKSLVQFAD